MMFANAGPAPTSQAFCHMLTAPQRARYPEGPHMQPLGNWDVFKNIARNNGENRSCKVIAIE